MMDAGNILLKASNMQSENKSKLKEMRARNMVQIANSEVIENLGQIDLCICDKTGTLTKNELIFKEFFCESKIIKVKYQADDVTKNN